MEEVVTRSKASQRKAEANLPCDSLPVEHRRRAGHAYAGAKHGTKQKVLKDLQDEFKAMGYIVSSRSIQAWAAVVSTPDLVDAQKEVKLSSKKGRPRAVHEEQLLQACSTFAELASKDKDPTRAERNAIFDDCAQITSYKRGKIAKPFVRSAVHGPPQALRSVSGDCFACVICCTSVTDKFVYRLTECWSPPHALVQQLTTA